MSVAVNSANSEGNLARDNSANNNANSRGQNAAPAANNTNNFVGANGTSGAQNGLNLPAEAANNSPVFGKNDGSGIVVIGDPHQNMPVGLESIINGLSSNILFMGDLPGDSSSKYSKMEARWELQVSQEIKKEDDSELYKAIKTGEFSESQMARVTGKQKRQKEIVNAHAHKVYSEFQLLFPDANSIAGNHDVLTMGDHWKNFHFQTNVDFGPIQGYALGAGGGEAVADTATTGITYAETGKFGKLHIDSARDDLMLGNMRNVFDHTGPFLNYGFTDASSERLSRIYDQRHKFGLNIPTTIIGHHHKDRAEFKFFERTDHESGEVYEQPVFHPGVLARETNSGSGSVFSHVTKFTEEGDIKEFDEYHLKPIFDEDFNRKIGVVKYGTHTVNWEDKEVDFEKLGEQRAVLEERTVVHQDESIDPNYAKDKKVSFNSDFAKYDSASFEDVAAATEQFISCVQTMNDEIDELSEKVKFALDATKNKWDTKFKDDTKISFEQKLEIEDDLIDALYATTLKDMGMKDVAKTVEEVDGASKLRLVKAHFGIDYNRLKAATAIADDDWENVAFNWGNSNDRTRLCNSKQRGPFSGAVGEHIFDKYVGRGQNGVLFSMLGEKLGNSMVDQFASQAVKRKKDSDGNAKMLGQQEVVGLLYNIASGGSPLLSADQLTNNYKEVFEKDENFKAAKAYTGKELDEMFNIDREVPGTIEYDTRANVSEDIEDKVARNFQEGKVGVYQDNQGEFIVDPQLGHAKLSDSLKAKLGDYTAKTIEEAMDAGEAYAVKSGHNYALEFEKAPGTRIKLDWDSYGIDPESKEVKSLYQSELKAKELRQGMQQELLGDLVRRMRDAQNGQQPVDVGSAANSIPLTAANDGLSTSRSLGAPESGYSMAS